VHPRACVENLGNEHPSRILVPSVWQKIRMAQRVDVSAPIEAFYKLRCEVIASSTRPASNLWRKASPESPAGKERLWTTLVNGSRGVSVAAAEREQSSISASQRAPNPCAVKGRRVAPAHPGLSPCLRYAWPGSGPPGPGQGPPASRQPRPPRPLIAARCEICYTPIILWR
jgi:hypothetical protein